MSGKVLVSVSDNCVYCNHHKYVHKKGFGKCKVENCNCKVLITWLPNAEPPTTPPKEVSKGTLDAYF